MAQLWRVISRGLHGVLKMSTIFVSQTTSAWRNNLRILCRQYLQVFIQHRQQKFPSRRRSWAVKLEHRAQLTFVVCFCTFEFRTPERMQ